MDAGCGDLVGSAAALDCLRNASTTDIRSAIKTSRNGFDYSGASIAWKPRADGVFLTDVPQYLVLRGLMADIPFVIGESSKMLLS